MKRVPKSVFCWKFKYVIICWGCC